MKRSLRSAACCLVVFCSACTDEDASDARDAGCCVTPLADVVPEERLSDVAAVDGPMPDASNEAAGRIRGSLVDPTRWVAVEPEADIFDDRPDGARCPEAAYFVADLAGELAFEVETGACTYLTVSQPSLRELRAGDRVHLRIWHFELTAADAAQAHVAVAIDGTLRWEEKLPIPSPSGLISRDWFAGEDLQAGTLVHFHLHNHGANSWALLELSGGPD